LLKMNADGIGSFSNYFMYGKVCIGSHLRIIMLY